MSYKKSKENLYSLIYADYPLIYISTEDERPVIETTKFISSHGDKKYEIYTWNSSSGLFSETNQAECPKALHLKDVFSFFTDLNTNAILILHDFHHQMKETNENVFDLKETVLKITRPVVPELSLNRYKNEKWNFSKHIIITAPVVTIPKEIDKLTTVIDFGLPGRDEIKNYLDIFLKSTDTKALYTEEHKEKIISSSLGLTETEIFNVYTKSLSENNGMISHKDIISEKEQIIKKDGTLEYYPVTTNLKDVGGLDNLIDWVKKRSIAFDTELRKKRQIQLPKGLLMTGIQGCGKSHCAKAISSYLEMPLLRLDIGGLMNKWLGESESNIRKAIKIAESISPAVLWIDEIDKVIPDPKSANSHETTKRIFSTLLTWLQEKDTPVFVVATANNIDHLPPELMRKGRFDEIFFIDLPNSNERKQIFEIHLNKINFDIKKINFDDLLHATEGFSGAEIKTLIDEANLSSAFQGEELEIKHLIEEANKTNPLSRTMKDKIDSIRKWAKENQVRPAS